MDTRGIAEGMTVRGGDGQKLGKVIECAADAFVVEKGLFFPKDYSVRYDQIADVRDGEVYLNVSDFEAAQGKKGEAQQPEGLADRTAAANEPIGAQPGDVSATSASAQAMASSGAAMGAESRDELRVPLAAEELDAERRERQAGEVKIHKEVVTETKQVSVPVTREEVRVERVPVQGGEPGAAAFREGTVSVPVREEEVEIRKRPVVKEEVRVSKTRRQEERRAEAEVRHEEARVEEQGDVERRGDIEGSGEGRDIDEPKR